MKSLILSFLTTFLFISAIYCAPNTTPRRLINYPNYYFVETGTSSGDGVLEAIQSGAFNKFYSIELEKNPQKTAQSRFKNIPNAFITLGDSGVELGSILQNINLPATFWLDASYGDCAQDEYIYNSGLTSQIEPLLQELAQIGENPIKTHTILIPNIQWLLDEYASVFTLTDIENAIYAINPNYLIEYTNGMGGTNNILVAYVP